MDTNDAQAYKEYRLPCQFVNTAIGSNMPRSLGDITLDTVVYDTNDGHPGGTYSHYSEKNCWRN